MRWREVKKEREFPFLSRVLAQYSKPLCRVTSYLVSDSLISGLVFSLPNFTFLHSLSLILEIQFHSTAQSLCSAVYRLRASLLFYAFSPSCFDEWVAMAVSWSSASLDLSPHRSDDRVLFSLGASYHTKLREWLPFRNIFHWVKRTHTFIFGNEPYKATGFQLFSTFL